MSFIRVQRIKRDAEGVVVSGTGSIVRCVYDREAKHRNRQEVVEKLGRVVWLGPDGRSGIFHSSSRGLVFYDAPSETFGEVDPGDARVAHFVCPPPSVHVVFGPTDIFLSVLRDAGCLKLLHAVFPDEADFQRLLAHQFHSVMRAGSRIGCDDFLGRSLLGCALDKAPLPSLRSDAAYYSLLGQDGVRRRYFRKHIAFMRKRRPGFGSVCVVDSRPLSGRIGGNPFDALAGSGREGLGGQPRLVVVLDRETLSPVWFQTMAGGACDVDALDRLREEMEDELHLKVAGHLLDAGYCSEELLRELFPEPGGTAEAEVVVRMPAGEDYPYRKLFRKRKGRIDDPGRTFLLDGHAYFGDVEEIRLFGRKAFAYVYVDQEDALTGFKEFVAVHGEEYDRFADEDKLFARYSGGYSVFLSTARRNPRDLLSECRRRSAAEAPFKAVRGFARELPLAQWTAGRVEGKLLSDAISAWLLAEMKAAAGREKLSLDRLIGVLEGSVCLVDDHRRIHVDRPGDRIGRIWKRFGREPVCGQAVQEYFSRMGVLAG